MSDGSTKYLERRYMSDGSTISSQGAGNSQSVISSEGAGGGGGSAGIGSADNPFSLATVYFGEDDGYVSDLTDEEYDPNLFSFYPTILPNNTSLSLDEFGRLNGEYRATL